MEPLKHDIARMKDGLAQVNSRAEGFMNAVSPGTIAVFQPNEYYPTHAAYMEALADAMQSEYEAIVNSGLLLQVDCPDLAMGRHSRFRDMTDDEFLRAATIQVEALNHALANVPADRVRMHVCWGNYQGPHTHDLPLAKILPVVLKAKPQALLLEGANPRHEHEWEVMVPSEASRQQGPGSGRHRIQLQLYRASRIGLATDHPLCRSGRARARHRRYRLWLWNLRRFRPGLSRFLLAEAARVV